jgi:hypothetical protein
MGFQLPLDILSLVGWHRLPEFFFFDAEYFVITTRRR